MSKLVEGLEKDAIVRVTIFHNGKEYEYILGEELYLNTIGILHDQGVEALISFLDNHKDVTEVNLSINIK